MPLRARPSPAGRRAAGVQHLEIGPVPGRPGRAVGELQAFVPDFGHAAVTEQRDYAIDLFAEDVEGAGGALS